MTNLQYYENQKRYHLRVINEEENAIRRTRRLLSTLGDFYGTAQRSKDEYQNMNRQKSTCLDPVNAVKKNNRTAQKYYNGMHRYFNSIGNGIVLIAFQGVLRLVLKKKNAYQQAINTSERSIAYHRNKINYYDRKIRAEKNLQNI